MKEVCFHKLKIANRETSHTIYINILIANHVIVNWTFPQKVSVPHLYSPHHLSYYSTCLRVLLSARAVALRAGPPGACMTSRRLCQALLLIDRSQGAHVFLLSLQTSV